MLLITHRADVATTLTQVNGLQGGLYEYECVFLEEVTLAEIADIFIGQRTNFDVFAFAR